ncbi:MAG TPA: VWA domain-containing protein, partial [Pyrinomonadaceae bacterium]|nr:VWA domain-containing protein [Pyrinomonadaceae bacterium]
MSPTLSLANNKDATAPRPRKGRPKRPSSLCLLLCIALASALTASAQSPGPQPAAQPSPTPTPYVRPRVVSPKPEPSPAASPAQTESPGQAQQPPQHQPQSEPEEVDEGEVVRVDSNLVLIPASVVDARGRAMTDLKLEDFELRVDGEVKPIGDLSRAETPVHIALLFDNSASLSAAREFEKQAAVRFFQSLVRPIDRAAVYSISTSPTLALPLTNDVRRLVQTIEQFPKPDGATALFDTLSHAADYMYGVAGRKVIVLVSDGTDTVSDTTFDEALARALRADCQVYVVQTRQIEDPNLHDPFSEGLLAKLTEQTGGAVFAPRSIDELDTAFTQISLDLSQQYLLSYYPAEERKDKYFRFINLRVKNRPQARVRARKGFYPLAPGDHSAPAELAKAHGKFSATSRPDATAAAPTTPAADARRKPVAGTSTKAQAARDAVATTNRRIGPAGPDDEERPRAAAAAPAPEPTATFTLTPVVSETQRRPAPTPSPSPAPPAPSQSLFSGGVASVAQPAPAPTATPTPTPTPAPAPTPAPKAEQTAAPKTPVSGGVLNSKAVALPRPVYPPAAKSVGVYGKVV